MYSIVNTASISGVRCLFVHVETDISEGLPMFEMVGRLSTEVREAKERIRSAMRNSGFLLPAKRITVNFSPTFLRKEGNGYDLPTALSIMSALQIIGAKDLDRFLIIGEVGLDGKVHAVAGVLPMVHEAAKAGFAGCIIPQENVAEASMISEIRSYGVSSIKEAVVYLNASEEERKRMEDNVKHSLPQKEEEVQVDFSDISRQHRVKRACEVAAAGMHHLLMIGPPGSGKTMIASRIATILPKMERDEQLEISEIYSIAGLLDSTQGLMVQRPFRSVHHSATAVAMIGGGRLPRPGEITLAHHGILFLDELAEFKREVLDTLRQPLEEHKVTLSRQSGTYEYPADFLLVAAMNPCRCGYYPDRNKCRCSKMQMKRYVSGISGPILDRIDITIEAPRISFEELTIHKQEETSAQIRKRILAARQIQEHRYQGMHIRYNALLPNSEVEKYCHLSSKQRAFMERVFERYTMSARSYYKILKLARTVADLEGHVEIQMSDLAEAVSYKQVTDLFTGGENS